MFRPLSTACSRAVASSSRSTLLVSPSLPQYLIPSLSSPTHLISRSASTRTEHARLRKKRNLELHAQRSTLEKLRGPHPVLGLPDTPAGDATWAQCDLARLIVDEEALEKAPIPPMDSKQIVLPEQYQFGIEPSDERILFQSLPALSAQSGLLGSTNERSQAELTEVAQLGLMRSQMQANYLARIVDLRNASKEGIAFENRRRCVKAFGRHEEDTGRPEVQAAILTVQIRNLWRHLKEFKKDLHNRRNLKALVHQRAKILKYLERKDPARFDALLPRLGLDPRAVKGEIIVKFDEFKAQDRAKRG